MKQMKENAIQRLSTPIRILHVLPGLTYCGGMESYLLNYYRHIDRSRIQFDFITHSKVEPGIRQEIESMGGRVFDWEPFRVSRFFSIRNRVKQFFQEHNGEYNILHCHMANAGFLYFPLAKEAGIKHCILHSHNNRAAAKLSHAIRNYPLLFLANREATNRIACTEAAGKFLFGNKAFTVIKNAIDMDRFAFSKDIRGEIRHSLNMEKNFIFGHVGRLDPQKNQKFAIKVFAELYKKNPEARLLFIGEGKDGWGLKKLVKELGLQDAIMFLGAKKNIEKYYQAFDAFIFPSLYEGLGIVLVEAQCSGLPVFASADGIPKDAKVSKLLTFIPLEKGEQYWAKIIQNQLGNMHSYERVSPLDDIRKAGYDIFQETKKMEEYYLALK